MFNKKNKLVKTEIKNDVRTIAEGLLIALVLRTLFIQPFVIPSGSMYPTLVVGDYVFATKYSYGISRYSIPFGGYILPNFGRLFESAPERGDVAIFRVTKTDQDFIKRVIGLSGDTVQMKNGRLYINNIIVEREQIENTSINGRNIATYIETLPNGIKHKIWELDGDNSNADNTPIYQVPADSFFMMGDNRDDSNDSRYSLVGYVPIDTFVGRARFIGWSLKNNPPLWKFWNWFNFGQASRIGKIIE